MRLAEGRQINRRSLTVFANSLRNFKLPRPDAAKLTVAAEARRERVDLARMRASRAHAGLVIAAFQDG
jgi:hypothetical protein